MRTIEYGTTTHVPAFLTKLWKLVTDASCDELISWSFAGTSFIIYDEIRFSKELLPMYFKHNNMASFVRQLNMYGFRKLSCIDQGGMHCYKNEIEFYHQYFIKGQETLLELIKRKIPNSKSEEPKVKQEYIEELLANIKCLRGKQDTAEQGMRTLKRENRLLWRHVNLLTDRYSKQQAVLQQLLPFFMNMVRSSREVALKRKTPLMIDEGDVRAKMARMSPPYFLEHNEQNQSSGMPSSPGNVSNRGPVIHDITEMEGSKMYPGNILCSSNTTTAKECEAIVDSPLSCSLENSDQTIDSPYTEPGSMETLNIVNHNFERSRSNSLSPHMEMKHSPVSAPSSSLQLSSQACAMPAAQSSMVNYTSVPNGIPAVSIMDETTSDVPLNGMMSSFVPKIEDTCTDSGMYAMDSIINESTSSMINERSPIINERSQMMSERSPVMNERSQMMNERSPLMNERSPLMNERSPLMNERSPLMNERSPLMNERSPLMNERSPLMNDRSSVMNDRSPVMNERVSLMKERSSMMKERSQIINERSPLMNDRSSTMNDRTPMINERTVMMNERIPMMSERTTMMNETAPVVNERTSMMNERVPRINESSVMPERSSMMNETSSAMRENAPTSGNKFLPNGFPLNNKCVVPDIAWLLNQETYGNEPMIENWLGQIFKSDNLVAGCSLPQDQAEAVN